MYINFQLVKSKGFTPKDVMVLQMCRQNSPEDPQEEALKDLLENDENVLKSFEEDGLIKFIKGVKKDSLFKKARLEKKGKLLLDQFQAYHVEEDDIKVYDWLKNIYLELGKEIGSEKKGMELCAWFRRESGISKNDLVILCKAFMRDEERMQYSLVLQYAFWKSENHFQVIPKLEDSKLWLYYEKYRDFFDGEFEKAALKRQSNND
jgi:hypothetical protein